MVNATKVANQGGVLEGGIPAKYNENDPIVLFIIQVRKPRHCPEFCKKVG